ANAQVRQVGGVGTAVVEHYQHYARTAAVEGMGRVLRGVFTAVAVNPQVALGVAGAARAEHIGVAGLQVGDTYYLGQPGYVHFYGIGALAVRAGVYVYPVGAALVVDGQLLGGVAGAPGVLGAGVPCIEGQRPCFTVGGIKPEVYGYRAVADGGDVGGGGTAD